MSKFSNLFPLLASQAYQAELISQLKLDENSFFGKDPKAGIYGFNGQAYTIGYGYDIRFQTGSQIISDFIAAGIFTLDSTDPVTGIVTKGNTDSGQIYGTLYTDLQAIGNNSVGQSASLPTINSLFTALFGSGTSGITQTQAASLLNDVIPRYGTSLGTYVVANNAQQNGLTLGNSGLEVLLMTEWYNGQTNVFGPTQVGDISNDNINDFLANVMFYSNKTGGIYSDSLEDRRLNDLATSLGIQYNAEAEDFNFNGKLYPALYIAQSIISLSGSIDSQITSLESGNSLAVNLATLKTNVLQSAEATLLAHGYYVPRLSDGSTPTAIAQSIVNQLNITGLTAATLQQLNAPFSGSGGDVSWTAGGLVHVPVGASLAVSTGGTTLLAPLPSGESYIFDTTTNQIYTVGASTNGQYPAGSLIVDTPAANGIYPAFNPGTYGSAHLDTSTGSFDISVTAPNGTVLFSYDTDPSVTFADGLQIALPDMAGVTLTDNLGANATPEELAVSYLDQLGVSLTTDQLNQLNESYLSPTGTAYNVIGGTVQTSPTTADVTYQLLSTAGEGEVTPINPWGYAPGAVIAGQPTVTIGSQVLTATNYLQVFEGDISQDTVSGIQVLDVVDYAALTGQQLSQFQEIEGGGEPGNPSNTFSLLAVGGGTFDASAAAIDPADNLNYIQVVDWSGTDVVGTDQDGQTLQASDFGNDTLQAGNGIGDQLIAGEGADTLIGGNGGDQFFGVRTDDGFINGVDVGYGGLSAGTIIQGNGADNVLTVSGDISGATITGVQTLDVVGALTLNAVELNEFQDLDVAFEVNFTAASGGIYDLTNRVANGQTVYMVAGSSDGTTLIDNNNNDWVNFTASQFGNDTLQAGGNGVDVLTGGGGNDKLIAGTGFDILDGGTGYTTYEIGANFGGISINNAYGGSVAPNGEIDFATGVTTQNLWFTQNGSDLLIRVLGTNKTVDVAGWFGGNDGAQVLSINAGGLRLSNSDVTALVATMATYQTNNPGFNPATATQMPSDPTLQATLASSWGSGLNTSNVTVAYAETNRGALDALGSYTVADTGANVAAGLDFLTSDVAHISGITLTDAAPPTLAISADQYASDSTALAKIGSAYNLSITGVLVVDAAVTAARPNVTSIQISDTAANVDAGLDALQALAAAGKIASITLTDSTEPTITVTAAQQGADATALGVILSPYYLVVSDGSTVTAAAATTATSPVAVADTAANVLANLAALETQTTAGRITSIAFTDSTIPTLALTAAQFTADAAVLAKITSAYNIAVSGVTAANAASVTANPHVTSITIADTAANIAANIAALETLATGTQLASITLTDSSTPTLSLTGAQLTADSPALAKITSAYNLALTGGGTTTMGSGVAGVQSVTLQSASSAYNFTANNDTGLIITDSSATNDTLTAGSGGDTLVAGTGNDTMNGGNAYNTYKFGSSFGQDVINNAAGGSTTAKGEIDFGTGISFKNLWFTQSGNDLVIRVLGTTDTVTVTGWFGTNAGAQVKSIKTADGVVLSNSQVTGLVSAMATYQSANPSFNPATATLPNNNTLLIAMVGAWFGDHYSTSVTLNANGTMTGVSTGGSSDSWSTVTTNYSAANQRLQTVEVYKNGSTITTTYSLTGGYNTYAFSGTLPVDADVLTRPGNNQIVMGNVTGILLDARNTSSSNILTVQDIISNSSPAYDANYNNILSAFGSTGNNTLTVGDGGHDYLRVDTSTGNNTLLAGNGNNDYLNAQSTHGANSLSAGNGNNDKLDVSFSMGNNTLTAGNGSNDILTAAGSTGNDTLTAGGGGDTLIAGLGNDTLNGGNAYNTYQFGTSFGQDVINNAAGGGTTAKGEVDFASGITSENLWFSRSGNDLVVTLLGTNDAITLTGWFGGNAGAQVQAFKAGGLQLSNSSVSSLVSAMATYQTNNPSFNPATATSMPGNSTLQTAISTAWPGSLNYTNVPVAYAQTNQTALDAHTGGYTVADTAANVTAGLSFLTSDVTNIGSITLTDTSAPTISLTGAQFTADSAALAKIVSPYNLSLSGGGTIAMGSSITNVENVTLQSGSTAYNVTGNNDAGLTITDFGSTNDTITVGNSFNENVQVGDAGVYTITTGTGSEDTVVALNGLKAGSSVTMHGTTGDNTLFAGGDISGATLSGVNDLTGLAGVAVKVSAAELSLAGLLVAPDMTLQAATGGTYNLATSGQSGDTLQATVNTGTTLIANNAEAETLIASASGTDTLTAGNGGDILVAGGGNDTLNGGNAYSTYQFGSSFGQDVINNAAGGSTTAKGEIDFGAGISFKNLWFTQSGNDLVIRVLGTTDTVTVTGWFGANAGAQVKSIKTADGVVLSNSQVAGLVSAMATYQTNNPSFNPATATLPNNNALLIAMVGAWFGDHYSTSVTLNADGTFVGVSTGTGSNDWSTVTTNYSAANQRLQTVEVYKNGSTITTTYSLTGGYNTYAFSGTLPVDADVLTRPGNNQIVMGDVTGILLDARSTSSDNILTVQDLLTNSSPSYDANYNNILSAYNSTGNNALTAGDGGHDYLRVDFSTGNNTLTAGNGSNVHLNAESTSGANNLSAGNGNNDVLDVSFSSGNNTLTAGNGSNDVLNAASSTGIDTLTAGNGGDTLIAGIGNDTLNGGNAYNTYQFGSSFGQDVINNAAGGGTTAQGEIDFTSSSITDEHLWFKQSGNNLVIELLGTNDQITVNGWFGSNAGAKVQSINADGLSIDSQVALLVQEMATYATNNPGFNPVTATSMPTDPTLQGAIAAAWHS